MTSVKDKLRGLLEKHRLMTGADLRRDRSALDDRLRAGEFEVGNIVDGQVMGDDESGHFFLARTDYALDSLHGNVVLGSVLDAIPEHIALSACDPELEDFDPLTAAFIDTETTGLAGGTGTVAFLVGVGYFAENDSGERVLRVDQCFMRDFDEEEAMLAYLDGIFSRCETVVSYNGKSYDLPLLRTRSISNRIPFRLEDTMHFDLLHAARRFWKNRLPNCTLGNIEKSILGIERHGDVDASLIPDIWFDYVRTRDGRKIQSVFYHHKMDILSLVTLTSLLSQCLSVPLGDGFEHVEDQMSLLRLNFRQKRYGEVVEQAERMLEQEAASVVREECLEMTAFAHKRSGNYELMQVSWERLLQECPTHLVARLELAKHHEHRTRNLPEAERLCQETLEFLAKRPAANVDGDSWECANVQHRLERIHKKLRSRKGGLEMDVNGDLD